MDIVNRIYTLCESGVASDLELALNKNRNGVNTDKCFQYALHDNKNPNVFEVLLRYYPIYIETITDDGIILNNETEIQPKVLLYLQYSGANNSEASIISFIYLLSLFKDNDELLMKKVLYYTVLFNCVRKCDILLNRYHETNPTQHLYGYYALFGSIAGNRDGSKIDIMGLLIQKYKYDIYKKILYQRLNMNSIEYYERFNKVRGNLTNPMLFL